MNQTVIEPTTTRTQELRNEWPVGERMAPPDLVTAYNAVDAYQPVFGFEQHFSKRGVSRGCIDRCEYLASEIGSDVKNLRILDVGCSMGYLTLYFARLGAKTAGYDYNEANIRFCQTLAAVHGLRSEFSFGTFGLDYARALPKGQFDVAFLFSVLHHVVHLYGLARTREIMAAMLERVDTLYVELALKTENVPFPWKQSLPEDELDIFADRDSLEIVRLADFPALGETTIRPLYRIRRKAAIANGITHRDAVGMRSAIKTGDTANRKYYLSADLFTKTFVFGPQDRETYSRFLAEVEAYRRLGEEPNFLPLLRYGIEGNTGAFTVPRVEGESLMEAIKAGRKIDVVRSTHDIARILRAFALRGLYWNDFRSHNLLVTEAGLKAVDFEVSAPVEIEHTLHLFAWMIADIQHGRLETQERGAFAKGARHVPPPPFELKDFAAEIRPFVELALQSRSVAQFAEGVVSLGIDTGRRVIV